MTLTKRSSSMRIDVYSSCFTEKIWRLSSSLSLARWVIELVCIDTTARRKSVNRTSKRRSNLHLVINWKDRKTSSTTEDSINIPNYLYLPFLPFVVSFCVSSFYFNHSLLCLSIVSDWDDQSVLYLSDMQENLRENKARERSRKTRLVIDTYNVWTKLSSIQTSTSASGRRTSPMSFVLGEHQGFTGEAQCYYSIVSQLASTPPSSSFAFLTWC